MTSRCIIGLDYGTESARGVLIDAETGAQIDSCMYRYRHGVMAQALPGGAALPRGWALQNAQDYTEAATEILTTLGNGREVASIGLGFTASTPMPATADGTPLSQRHPDAPHAYVKLWKHGAAQSYADAINATGGAFLDNFGGKLSGEWLLAKAAQMEAEAPDLWAETDRFIEAGDWLVWQLTGQETRSLAFAAFKAQFDGGYPQGLVPGLQDRLSDPARVGSSGGGLCAAWRQRTGIKGAAIVAVAVIDSHVVLPAIHAVSGGSFVGALGTSAAYLFLSKDFRPLPKGIEGAARDASVRDLWCYEAGQACFGDILAWFVRCFPRGATPAESFEAYGAAAAAMQPGESHLLAVDWWSGNRVPLADSNLSGMLLGMTLQTTAVGIYRALMESLCFGAKFVLDLFEADGFTVDRVVMTSGLAANNPALIQIMADVMERPIEVPQIAHATAVGAAIHGAVAAQIVAGFDAGAAQYGAARVTVFQPDPARAPSYRALYDQYRAVCADAPLRQALKALGHIPRPVGAGLESVD
ncbi:FGGY-family carbohydrate kinase [Roseicitreum antarcticum]|uniref:L-ribulokinase n=1 Tax=Roseicitreum antarcticum TaxID=564137 RepID=A0A1H3FHW8_9RHOB|nr:FGGY-family carbohydrate kinase [Roseicitreum antarcticum]SDX89734.1 L-ribulokinase [Roseicitreum antarcticum]